MGFWRAVSASALRLPVRFLATNAAWFSDEKLFFAPTVVLIEFSILPPTV